MVKDNLIILISLIIIFLGFFSASLSYVGYQVLQPCVDSDGLNPLFKGTVRTGFNDVEDTCVSDEPLVQEFLCENNNLIFQFITCSGSCEDGACIPAPLTQQPSQPSALDGAVETFSISTTNDQLEINERIGDVVNSLTNEDLEALDDGTVSNARGSSEYSQIIRFNNNLNSGKAILGENEDNDVGHYLLFDEDIFEYELLFSGPFESEIDGSNIDDYEGEDINMLGSVYQITEARKNGNTISMSFVGGEFSDILEEGEAKQYTVNGQPYTVEIFIIDDNAREATFEVNGELTNQLEQGQSDIVDGIRIGVLRVFLRESGDGKDLVEFFIGSKEITFSDDASDDSFSSDVMVNGETIDKGSVKIKGSTSGNVFRMNSITYKLEADGIDGPDVYVPVGERLSNYLDEPEGLLFDWDIVYGGEGSDDTEPTLITFDPSGDSQYQLRFANQRGDSYIVDLVTNDGGNLVLGDGSDALHFIEGTSTSNFIIGENDYFIVTDDNDRSGRTHILRYESVDAEDNQLSFDDIAQGSIAVNYQGTEGIDAAGDLIIGGTTYRVFVGAAPDYSLAIDMDNDGDVDGSEVKLVTQGGAIFDLGSSITPGGTFAITLTTEAEQFDGSSGDEVITLSLVRNGDEVDIDIPSQSSLTIETDDDLTVALSDYGVRLEKDDDNPDTLDIYYPLGQAFADVIVAITSGTSSILNIPQSTLLDDCGNTICDIDEGWETCAQDCDAPAALPVCGDNDCDAGEDITNCPADCTPPGPVCGNGQCETGENSLTCSQDCQPVIEQPTPPQGFWTRFWEWLKGLFS
mgnify:CR=1 FL=1